MIMQAAKPPDANELLGARCSLGERFGSAARLNYQRAVILYYMFRFSLTLCSLGGMVSALCTQEVVLVLTGHTIGPVTDQARVSRGTVLRAIGVLDTIISPRPSCCTVCTLACEYAADGSIAGYFYQCLQCSPWI